MVKAIMHTTHAFGFHAIRISKRKNQKGFIIVIIEKES